MTTTPQQPPDREPTIADVLEQLDALKADVKKLSENVAQGEKWQDRTWDAVKWVSGLSTALIFSLSVAAFGIAFRKFVSGS